MPPVKKDVRKNAWAWVENAPPDYKISNEDVYKVYRMDIPKCKIGSCKRNCRGNPFCLNGIGEARWLNETIESISDIEDPDVEKRQEKNFVGLKNLGATCYVNSLLQLWFHNAEFREVIFSWNPLHDPKEGENPTLVVEDDEILFTPQSVVGHLQVLFAMLALSKKRSVDPTDFVTSLGLDTSEQQDAQEFSKLFLSLLENKLRDQVNPAVTNFIQHNFCGEYDYVTRCSKCLTESTRPSQFYELDLNILGMKTLKESLADFLKEEKLDGANMYFCGVCNEKQNAERFIKLKSLPPTLCFQLMRFVFDRQKGKKKKLTSHLQFPETVDMTEYIENASRPYIYNLSAVLIHKGPGAYSGHYIAHILTSQGWYKFNDESIENMDGKKLKFGEDDLDEFAKKSKTPRVPKGSLASSNAYMLVYTLQKDEESKDAPIEDPATLSNKVRQKLNPKVLRVVEDKNNQFNKWVEEITECRNSKLDKNLQLKMEVASLVRLLPVEEEEKRFDVVPSSWLMQWLSYDGDKSVTSIDNSALLCGHDKINPHCVSDAKYISSHGADTLYEQYSGGPRLQLLGNECMECISNEFSLLKLRAKTTEEQKTITLLTKNKMEVDMPGFWVSRRSLKSWKKIVLERAEKQLNPTSPRRYKEEQEEPSSSGATLNGNNACSSTNFTSAESGSNSNNQESLKNKTTTAGDSPIIGLSSTRNKSSGNSTSSPVKTPTKNPVENNQRVSRVRSRLIKQEKDEVSSSSEPHSDPEKSEGETNEIAFRLTSRSPSIAFSPRTRNKISTVKQCYTLLNSVDESLEQVKTNLFGAEDTDEDMEVKSAFDKSVDTVATEVGSMKTACKHILDRIVNKRQRVVRALPMCDLKESKSDLAVGSASNCANSCDSDGEMSPVLGRGESSKRCNEMELYNGSAKKIRSDFSVKAENDNAEDSDEFEDLNDDIVCEHGNLCYQENLRRLVPLEVWNILKSHFPTAKAFTNEAEPCSVCESLANEDEFAKDVLKQQAQQQKELLGDLLFRISTDSNKLPIVDDRPIYLVSVDFISDWRKFVRGSGKNEQPSSIDNRHLFCECGKLLYNPDEESERSMFVAVTEEEFRRLSAIYRVLGFIRRSKDPDTQIVQTEPDVCQTCYMERLEKEHKAQLTYTNAKIFIRFVQDNSDPGSDDSSTNPKKPKLNNGTSAYVPPGVSNGCSSSTEVLEVRRSSRPRRGRGEKEIVVSSDDTVKDIKVKIYEMVGVAPYDQQLSKSSGERLDDNTATLSSVGIYPSNVLLVKFTENAAGDACASDFISSAPVEAGFKGTELMKTF